MKFKEKIYILVTLIRVFKNKKKDKRIYVHIPQLEMIYISIHKSGNTSVRESILKRLGYEVKTKTNPVEAFELIQSKPGYFDLVITDMTMPQMSGVKLSAKLKGGNSDVPVIICTGHSSQINEEKAKQLGIDAYVIKPIVMRDIAKTIRKVLDKAIG